MHTRPGVESFEKFYSYEADMPGRKKSLEWQKISENIGGDRAHEGTEVYDFGSRLLGFRRRLLKKTAYIGKLLGWCFKMNAPVFLAKQPRLEGLDMGLGENQQRLKVRTITKFQTFIMAVGNIDYWPCFSPIIYLSDNTSF